MPDPEKKRSTWVIPLEDIIATFVIIIALAILISILLQWLK